MFILDERKMESSESSKSSTSILDLPENCITHILSLTTPRDVCRSSAVSSSFLSAASSDYVWGNMLPPDVHHLLSRSVVPPTPFSSKKEFFFGLCSSPLIIDLHRKSFSLDRSSGKKCFMLAARELKIVWVDDQRYWGWVNMLESRFPEVAELLDVCWLDISGKISTADLSPCTRYAAYFVFKHTNSSTGFQYFPARLSIRVNDSPHVLCEHSAFIHADNGAAGSRQHRWRAAEYSTPRSALCPRKGYGRWMEIEVGEFFTHDVGEEVEFSLMQTSGQWKRGMLLEGLEIRPKY